MTQPVFLIGLPRTGTTWASRALAAATRRRIVHEPFNWRTYPQRVGYHMRYLPAGAHDAALLAIVRQALQPPFPLGLLPRFRRVVVKDVHICLAIEYLWQELRPHIIILMRHPCAMASSWARLEYEVTSRIDLLLGQERLLQEHLEPFAAHLRRSREEDFFWQVGAYWGAAYYVLARQAQQHPEWQWVTHEQLCASPGECFAQLVQGMGLDMQQSGWRFLSRHNRARSAEDNDYSLFRVTEQEPDKWQQVLTTEQVQAVQAGAEPFGLLARFYAE